MSSLEPINVYTHCKEPHAASDIFVAASPNAGSQASRKTNAQLTAGGAPNPFKVLIILEELGVPYKKVSSGGSDWPIYSL
jgi:hypothetical protein